MAGGSIQAMNSAIKNNRNLLKKNRSFLKNKKDLFKVSGGELEFKKLSKIELKNIKAKIRKKARKESIIRNSILLLIFFTLLASSVYLGFKEYKAGKRYDKSILEKEKRHRFKNIISSADFHLGRENLKRTLIQYKHAKILYPNDSLVNGRIKLVDSLIKANYQTKIEKK